MKGKDHAETDHDSRRRLDAADAALGRVPTPAAATRRLPDLDFATVAADYLSYIQHSEGLADRTVDTYRDWLSHYKKWLDSQEVSPGLHDRFSTPVLQRFRYSLSMRGLRPRTVRTIFGPLRQLGEYCLANGLIEHNSAKDIKLPKKDASGRKRVSQEELKQLLAAVERQRDKKKVALHRAMLSVLIFCGPHFREWLDLKVEHVDFERKSILIANGKGSKSRTLYPVPECMDAIAEYLRVRPTDCRHSWLWHFDVRRRMGETGARQMIDDVKAVAGLEAHDNIQPHAIRHAFATRLVENGVNIKAVQAALGHEHLATTYIYIHGAEEAAKPMQGLGGFDKPAPVPHASDSPTPAVPSVPSVNVSGLRRQSPLGRDRVSRSRLPSFRHR